MALPATKTSIARRDVLSIRFAQGLEFPQNSCVLRLPVTEFVTELSKYSERKHA